MAFPQDPQLIPEAFSDVVGGANQRKTPLVLEPNEVVDALNIDMGRQGKWRPRAGSTSFGGRTTEPGGLTWFRDLTDDIIGWAIFGSRLHRSTFNGSWNEAACAVSLVSGHLHMFTEGLYSPGSDFVQTQDRALYGCQCVPQSGVTDSTLLFVFRPDDGDSATQITTHAPRVITYWQGRLWKADDQIGGNGSDLGWSELDDGLTFSPANELNIEPGVGGKIRALVPGRDDARPQLFVFKQEAVALLEPSWGSSSALIPGAGDELDTVNSRVQLLTSGVGCIAPRSALWVPGQEGADILFLARDGVRSLARAQDDTAQGAGPPLTFSIPDWIDRINFDHAHKATAAFFDNAYHLAVPMDGAENNTHVLVFNVLFGNWSLHAWDARDIQQIPVDNDERFWFQNHITTQDCSFTGQPESLYQIYRGFQGSLDPGETFVDYLLETRAFVFKDPTREKRWDHLFLLGTLIDAGATHELQVVWRKDFEDWQTAESRTIFSVPPQSIVMGSTPLPWALPDNSLVQRRISLLDVDPGTVIQFRFLHGQQDSARPEYHFTAALAYPHQRIFDNAR